MIFLANVEEEKRKVGVSQISKATGCPEPFAAKVLQQLVRNKLLRSFKGPSGGYQLIENKTIILNDIVVAIDGPDILERCVLGLSDCSSAKPCPIHERYIPIRKQLKETILSTSIGDTDFSM